MTAWAHRLSQGAREVRDSWETERQVALQRAVEALCLRPNQGRYLAEDRAWVYVTREDPPLRLTYRLDRNRRQIHVEHVALLLVPRRQIEIDMFLSYSRRDRTWFHRLRRTLLLLREFDIVLWTDQDLLPGQKWHELIQSKVAESGAAVLLVSQDFLSSEYIQAHELEPFLARAEGWSGRSDDRPFVLLWIPLTHRHLLREDAWGRRLLAFEALVDPDQPLAAQPPRSTQHVLENIRDIVHKTLHQKLRRAAR